MSARRKAVQLDVGYHVAIDVTLEKYSSTDSFGRLPLSKRKCGFKHETENLPMQSLQ